MDSIFPNAHEEGINEEDEDLYDVDLESPFNGNENEEDITFQYLNEGCHIHWSDWKDPPSEKIFIETNSSEHDVNKSLKTECLMIKKTFVMSSTYEISNIQAIQLYFGDYHLSSPASWNVVTYPTKSFSNLWTRMSYHSFS